MNTNQFKRKEWLDHYRWTVCTTCQHNIYHEPSVNQISNDRCEEWTIMPGELWQGDCYDSQFKAHRTQCEDFLLKDSSEKE